MMKIISHLLLIDHIIPTGHAGELVVLNGHI